MNRLKNIYNLILNLLKKIKIRSLKYALLFFAIFYCIYTVVSFVVTYRSVAILKDHYILSRYNKDEEEIDYEFTTTKPKEWVNIKGLNREITGAFVVSEDWTFYSHNGIDVEALKDAINETIESGQYLRGGSTITQQLIKNVFLSREKTLMRKGKEILLAMELEKHITKSKILENYLNVIEYGEGIYGIYNASYYYFKKSPYALNGRESAFLAMLLPNPKKYSNSYRNRHLTRYASRTINSILNRMRRAHFISEERYQELYNSRFGWEG
ncbi:MAG: biosynthetic peptidoglycan transglycosylase [Bacteriovoracaceae bacterium]